MHIPTHILSGWVVGNCFPLTAAQRLGCMIIATVADLDGLGLLVSRDLYDRWHHVAGHNLPVCIGGAALLAVVTARTLLSRLLVGLLYVAIFHLHLVMDYYGSGPGWPIVYLWPFSDFRFINWDAWELTSWQNSTAGFLLIAITVLIAWRARRTPLELLYPRLDRTLTGRPQPGASASAETASESSHTGAPASDPPKQA